MLPIKDIHQTGFTGSAGLFVPASRMKAAKLQAPDGANSSHCFSVFQF
jgi:hypothetical protein